MKGDDKETVATSVPDNLRIVVQALLRNATLMLRTLMTVGRSGGAQVGSLRLKQRASECPTYPRKSYWLSSS